MKITDEELDTLRNHLERDLKNPDLAYPYNVISQVLLSIIDELKEYRWRSGDGYKNHKLHYVDSGKLIAMAKELQELREYKQDREEAAMERDTRGSM